MLKLYAARPNHTVIGTVLGEGLLGAIETGGNTKVITVSMDVRNVDDPRKALEKLKTEHGVSQIDIVRINASQG